MKLCGPLRVATVCESDAGVWHSGQYSSRSESRCVQQTQSIAIGGSPLVSWLGLTPAGPVKKSDLNPRELSARGKGIYNELARELGMPALQEAAPAQVSEQVSEQ